MKFCNRVKLRMYSSENRRLLIIFFVSFIISAIVLYFLFYYIWHTDEIFAVSVVIIGAFLISISNTMIASFQNK